MADQRDVVEIGGWAEEGANAADTERAPAGGGTGGFLRLWFRCSGLYARGVKTADGTAYVGRCPKCGAAARFPIGPGGTSVRVFEVSCR